MRSETTTRTTAVTAKITVTGIIPATRKSPSASAGLLTSPTQKSENQVTAMAITDAIAPARVTRRQYREANTSGKRLAKPLKHQTARSKMLGGGKNVSA